MDTCTKISLSFPTLTRVSRLPMLAFTSTRTPTHTSMDFYHDAALCTLMCQTPCHCASLWPSPCTPENAKFAGPSDRKGYFLSGSGKHPSITGPCDRLIVHCSPFLPHACAKLHLQWVCQKASGSAKNLVSAGPVVWHIKKSFRILWHTRKNDQFIFPILVFCIPVKARSTSTPTQVVAFFK